MSRRFSVRCNVVVSGHMFGGGQQIAKELVDRCHSDIGRVEVVLLGGDDREFRRLEPVIIEYDGSYNRIRTLVGTARRMRQYLQHASSTLVHTHGWDADVICWWACRHLEVKQITHLHVTPEWLRSKSIQHVVRRWLTRRVLTSQRVKIVAVSNAVRIHWTQYLGLDPDNVQVIHNGVDVERYRPVDKSDNGRCVPVIGIAARLAPMKGIEYLLDAIGALYAEGILFKLEIAGTGELREYLQERVLQMEIGCVCHFLGHVDDMPTFYRGLDIYVLPSVSTEGLPLSILEAMASGVPVVATTISGIPEAVRDGKDGFLVTPRNSTALAEKLKDLLRDAEKREQIGKSARKRAIDMFSMERFTKEVFALYR